jgi:uncharacterized membrane protein YphA (DoxX/SURF4 family)
METTNKELHRIQLLLKLIYGIVPIVAGADKFTNLLARWKDYQPQALSQMLPFSATTFMMVVGVIEIVAGILVLVMPQKGAYVVCAWLVLIAILLLSGGAHFDIAVRDLVMAAGAYTLARISGITNNLNLIKSNG